MINWIVKIGLIISLESNFYGIEQAPKYMTDMIFKAGKSSILNDDIKEKLRDFKIKSEEITNILDGIRWDANIINQHIKNNNNRPIKKIYSHQVDNFSCDLLSESNQTKVGIIKQNFDNLRILLVNIYFFFGYQFLPAKDNPIHNKYLGHYEYWLMSDENMDFTKTINYDEILNSSQINHNDINNIIYFFRATMHLLENRITKIFYRRIPESTLPELFHHKRSNIVMVQVYDEKELSVSSEIFDENGPIEKRYMIFQAEDGYKSVLFGNVIESLHQRDLSNSILNNYHNQPHNQNDD